MSLLNTHRTRGTHTFIPRVEDLEERLTPICDFAVHGSTLVITAPTTSQFARSDIIIWDNGTDQVNNIKVFCEQEFVPNVAITNVAVLSGEGVEHVSYNVTRTLETPRYVFASLGGSNDSFRMNLTNGLGPAVSLSLTVNGGPGDDHIQLKSTTLDPGASLRFVANGGGGKDVIQLKASSLRPGASLQFVANGGGGKDLISADVLGTIALGSSLSIRATGAAGNDFMRFHFGGILRGTVTMNSMGGPGNDFIRQSMTLAPDSTGRVIPGWILGGAGNDQIRYLVRDYGKCITFNQQVNGGLGTDEVIRTTNVRQIFCELDTVLP
jgi:hypothetical protein